MLSTIWLFKKLSDLACRRGNRVLLATAAATALCAWPTWHLAQHLETDIAALLPDDYRSVRTLAEIKRHVRGTENLILVIECPDFGSATRFADDIAEKLQGADFDSLVKSVDYRRDVGFFQSHALLYMDVNDLRIVNDRLTERIELERLRRSPLYVSLEDDEEDEPLEIADLQRKYKVDQNEEVYHTDPAHTAVTVTVTAAGSATNLGFGRALEKAVGQAVEELSPASYHSQLTVEYGGSFRSKIDEYDVIRHDITSSLAYGVIGIVLLLGLYFRQALAVLFVVVPLLSGLAWAFGITWWAIGRLNTVTGFLFVILFGLGIDFGIHLFARYLQDRRAGKPAEAAVTQMLAQTGPAMLTAGLTTVAAFYALTITDFKGFSEFGFIVGTGILTTMLAMVTVLPAMLLLADRDLRLLRIRPVIPQRRSAWPSRFPAPGPVLAVCAAATAFMAYQATDVEFEYDFTSLRADLPASKAIRQKIDLVTGSGKLSNSPSIVLASNKQELDEIVDAVQLRIAAPDSTPTIETIRTLWSALPGQQGEKMRIIRQMRAEIDSVSDGLDAEDRFRLEQLRALVEADSVEVLDLPESIRRRFTDADGQLAYLAFIYPKVQLRDGRNAMAFAADSEQIQTASGKTFYSSSSNIVFADMLRVMLNDSRTALAATAFVVVLIILVDLRSLRAAALVLLPLSCGIVWMLGSMHLLGMKLNFYNMVVLPSILGMGVDNGVHLYHRYCVQGRGKALPALQETAGPMLACLLTTMLGFAGMVTARHPGLHSIGTLALIGLGTCFIASVTVLPAALEFLEDRSQQE